MNAPATSLFSDHWVTWKPWPVLTSESAQSPSPNGGILQEADVHPASWAALITDWTPGAPNTIAVLPACHSARPSANPSEFASSLKYGLSWNV